MKTEKKVRIYFQIIKISQGSFVTHFLSLYRQQAEKSLP